MNTGPGASRNPLEVSALQCAQEYIGQIERDIDRVRGNLVESPFGGAVKAATDDELARVSALVRDLARTMDYDVAHASDLALARSYAHGLAVELKDAIRHSTKWTRDVSGPHVLDLARDIARITERAKKLVAALGPSVPVSATGAGDDRSVPESGPKLIVGWPARRLAVLAARFLPLRARDRYAKEFESELWDLANAGASRRHQFTHATRLLIRAWQLRVELKSPHRSGATR